jgi:hypothetical protein
MSDPVRVYVNGRGIDVPVGSTAVAAVRLADRGEGAEIDAGRRAIADSRGLPVDPATTVFGGAILRTVANRAKPGT